ncbi:PE family protein [Mycobacterium simiae]|uniref:PE family protein n=1 Tax=Mycobacterium simiae TaxID=1784 RepID=A0A5B1BDI2_MYCSI|nr:PE domain-containing protein [Mycobacterium simiae]KAA1246657.1 PE family protein [Mycobacterium simiae]
MSFLSVSPEFVAAVAGNTTDRGSTIGAANSAAAARTTQVLGALVSNGSGGSGAVGTGSGFHSAVRATRSRSALGAGWMPWMPSMQTRVSSPRETTVGQLIARAASPVAPTWPCSLRRFLWQVASSSHSPRA